MISIINETFHALIKKTKHSRQKMVINLVKMQYSQTTFIHTRYLSIIKIKLILGKL